MLFRKEKPNMQYGIITIKSVGSNSGSLSFVEGLKDIPFEIKRIYYITQVKAGIRRGSHAHKTLQQLLFCPYGKIRIDLNDGKEKHAILLDRPNRGLLLNPGLWREMLWLEDNSVLCVAASDYYDEDDYIRDYQAFLKYIKEQGK